MANPIALPDVSIIAPVFRYIDPKKISRLEGRATQTVYDYAGWWKASYSLTLKNGRGAGAISVFLSNRGDFIAFNPKRMRPAAYGKTPLSGTTAVGNPFNGEAAMIDLTARNAPQLSGLPAGFQLKEGDLVEFRQSITVRSLHKIKLDAVADASGLVTLNLSWPIPEPIVQADAVHFEMPSCIMNVQSSSEPMSPGTSTFSFEAVEVFPG